MRSNKELKIILITVATVFFASSAQASEKSKKVAELFESSFAHEVTGNTDRALNDVLKILRVNPSIYVANYRAGWLYYSKGRFDDSIKFYRKASVLEKKSVEAKLGLMLPLMAKKRWAEAKGVGEQLIKGCPSNYLASSRLAFIYFSMGKYKDAQRQYSSVLSMYPSEIEMMLGLGWTYVRQGRKTEARGIFNRVLSIRRQNLSARAGLEAL